MSAAFDSGCEPSSWLAQPASQTHRGNLPRCVCSSGRRESNPGHTHPMGAHYHYATARNGESVSYRALLLISASLPQPCATESLSLTVLSIAHYTPGGNNHANAARRMFRCQYAAAKVLMMALPLIINTHPSPLGNP